MGVQTNGGWAEVGEAGSTKERWSERKENAVSWKGRRQVEGGIDLKV